MSTADTGRDLRPGAAGHAPAARLPRLPLDAPAPPQPRPAAPRPGQARPQRARRPAVRRGHGHRRRRRPDHRARRRSGRAADHRHRPAPRCRRPTDRRLAHRAVAGQRLGPLPPRQRQLAGHARPQLHRRRALPHRRRRHLPLHDDPPRRLPVGQPPQRLAPGAPALLACSAAPSPSGWSPRCTSPTTRCSSRTRSTTPSPSSPATPSSPRYDHDTTTAEWALGFRFDMVLRGPDRTPFEEHLMVDREPVPRRERLERRRRSATAQPARPGNAMTRTADA